MISFIISPKVSDRFEMSLGSNVFECELKSISEIFKLDESVLSLRSMILFKSNNFK